MDLKGKYIYRLVSIMMCTHTETNISCDLTLCNECGLILDRKTMTKSLNMMFDTVGRDIAEEILDEKRDPHYNICEHQDKCIDGGTPFCTECGLTFEDETVYSREVHNMDQHYLRRPTKTKEETTKTKEETTKEETTKEETTKEVEIKPKEAMTEPKPKESEIEPKNVKDLVTIAKGRGIKNSTTMSKKKLCEILGLEIVKPDKLAFKNKETGEERRFKSIYRASKEMGVNPGLIHHHIGSSGEMTVDGVVYDVCKIQIGTQ